MKTCKTCFYYGHVWRVRFPFSLLGDGCVHNNCIPRRFLHQFPRPFFWQTCWGYVHRDDIDKEMGEYNG